MRKQDRIENLHSRPQGDKSRSQDKSQSQSESQDRRRMKGGSESEKMRGSGESERMRGGGSESQRPQRESGKLPLPD